LAAERKTLGIYIEGEYDFPVRVVYPNSEEEANKFFRLSNVNRSPKKADIAFNSAYPIGRWAGKLALESGLPHQLVAGRIGTILDCAFYSEDGNPFRVNMGGNHRLTLESASQSNTEDIPVGEGLHRKIKAALSAFSEIRRESEYIETNGKTVKDIVKQMLLLTAGRPSPGFLVVYLLDYFSGCFGGFTTKTPSRILQRMNTHNDDLFKLCKDYTRKQGQRHSSKIEIQNMMHVKS
jgi:hypothetical protein